MAEPDRFEPTSRLGRIFPAADLMTGKPKTSGLRVDRKISLKVEISRGDVLSVCVQRQAAAVGMLLRFFRLGFLSSAERS
jgi:hypothetical protein